VAEAAELRREVVNNACELMVTAGRCGPAPEIIDEPGFVRVKTGIPARLLNGVLRTNLTEQEARAKAPETLRHFQECTTPMEWWVSEDMGPANLRQILEESGYKLLFMVPGMVLEDLQSREFDTSSKLEVAPVLGSNDLPTLEYLLTAFGLPEHIRSAYCRMIESTCNLESRLLHVIGKYEGEPVCCGAVYFGKKSAGIYTIGTLEAVRGQGFGRAVTEHLLAQAKQRGYDGAVLTSSEKGYRVYEKLGFREVTQIAHYAPAEG
jgi:GNAT superfamily N-acetyltransferase